MSFDKPIRRIAIVGTGVIGASWAAQYLARGFDVVATDPAPERGSQPAQVRRRGLGAARRHRPFAGRIARPPELHPGHEGRRCRKADFVQENGPERPDFKMKLFADMDDATPVDSIIASSSSGITPSVMQSKCKHPERVLVGHPVQSAAHHSARRSRRRQPRRRPKPSSRRWRSTRRSARSRFTCGRNFPATSPTGCKRRSIGKCSTSSSRAC